ncbi:hypothetical protein B9K06_25415 [Bacillus sp. OG2]|nr:hypothetical protein B9K06_25415 [Bacillus sp. OG2]
MGYEGRFVITAAGIEPLPLGGCIPPGMLLAALVQFPFSFLRSPHCNNSLMTAGRAGVRGKKTAKPSRLRGNKEAQNAS